MVRLRITMPEANPNNDEFQCDHCGRIFPLVDAIRWENKELCPGCDEVVSKEDERDERDIDREYDQ